MTRANDFFASTVKPTVDEFIRESRDIRRGRLAAIVLFHMADYWALEQFGNTESITIKRLCKELIAGTPDFLLIRDVANASKHDRLTSKPDPARQLTSSDQVYRNPGLFEAPLNTAMLGEASLVWVTFDDKTKVDRPLLGIVRSVVEMWESKLKGPPVVSSIEKTGSNLTADEISQDIGSLTAQKWDG